ncbi:MAG TPA: tetratricopeptide repeat protein, partial [Planctomycetaceae bacterium]|nr:tetratricopeptide repeat protein [Planctomycetaceae bacterium]
EQRIESKVPWMSSGIELRGLYLLALAAVDPNHAEVARLADWLLAARVGSRWPVEKANGPVIAALAKWSNRTRRIGEKYTLTLEVNGKPVETFTVDPSKEGSRRLRVSAEFLNADKPQQISFQLEGRGSFTYSAVLTGFVATADLKSTAKDWQVSRRYEPHLRKHKGKDVPRGFGVLEGSYNSFTNPLTQLPVGVDGYVTLFPRRHNTTGQPGEQYDYLVLTEPIPAGCTIPEDSISGQFERYEIEPGFITFYLGNQRYPQNISYRVVGYVPGEYRARPTIVRSFYDPQQIAVGTPVELAVLHAGEDSKDEYRLTPDELYHLGRLLAADKEHAAAHKHLSDLFDNWRLRNEQYKEVVSLLFQTSLATESHGEIVKFFEIIKEKFADIEVRFEDILKVALSYRELGEYERSYLVYRATVQGSFERESQVAGFLNARGEFFRSVQVLEDLLRDYPAESYLAVSTYALAQEVYRKAPHAKDDPKLKEAGLTRVHLIDNAIHMLDHFVSTFPNDPAADQASFATASALLDLDKYQAAIDRCQQYAVRYPSSRLLDSFWYIIGYSHFELGQHQQALEMCEKVAEAKFPVPETGGTRPADNKWEAIYIMGQVYHALGKASEAIEEYGKVKTRFPDASETIDFFTHKDISLDEVTTVKPGDLRKLKLHYRNIAEVSLKVYRIDLMKFGLMQRNLDRITAINLAGIKPYHEETVELGEGKDYRDLDRELELPLKEEGAYLVVCRGDNLYASGLVLVSPLSLEIQEDATSGRVRVTIKDAVQDAFKGDVHVKVIGSANEEFRSGETDLRGLFIADDIRGTSTVIARASDNLYAFHRGKTLLQNVVPEETPPPPNAAADKAEGKPMMGKELLRGNIENQNGIFQQEQQGNYDNLLNNSRKGLMPSEAF